MLTGQLGMQAIANSVVSVVMKDRAECPGCIKKGHPIKPTGTGKASQRQETL